MPSKRYCMVCKNYSGKMVDGIKVSMHRFPTDANMRNVWIRRCKNARPNFKFKSSDNTRICSFHFVGRSGPTQTNTLPSIFPTASGSDKIYRITTMNMDHHMDVEECLQQTEKPETETAACTTDTDHETTDHDFEGEAEGLVVAMDESPLNISLKFHEYCQSQPEPAKIRHQITQCEPEIVQGQPKTVSVAVQTIESKIAVTRCTQTECCTSSSTGVQANRPTLVYSDICDNNAKVLFYTGIPDSDTFKCLFDELEQGMQGDGGRGRPKSMLAIDEFFMVLMRLRLGLLLEDLADRFCVSVTTCGRVFNKWIEYLDSTLSFLVKWPSRKNIDDTMPLSFCRKYPKCRVIIDCTEIRTETPSSLQLKSLMYSDYKSHMTWKSLVGISPSGIVTFVSDLYPGSISDKKITQKCNLVGLCETGDAIMVDKGFLISDLTTPKGVELIIPPFKKKNKQFLPQEVEATKSIANLRIHVEREMERIKNFRILQGNMPISMASQASRIWKVCVYLTNLLPPLVKN